MQTTYYGLMKQAKQSGLLDKSERLYFVSDTFTINLIPQALLLLGWLACNVPTGGKSNNNNNNLLSYSGGLYRV